MLVHVVRAYKRNRNEDEHVYLVKAFYNRDLARHFVHECNLLAQQWAEEVRHETEGKWRVDTKPHKAPEALRERDAFAGEVYLDWQVPCYELQEVELV